MLELTLTITDQITLDDLRKFVNLTVDEPGAMEIVHHGLQGHIEGVTVEFIAPSHFTTKSGQ